MYISEGFDGMAWRLRLYVVTHEKREGILEASVVVTVKHRSKQIPNNIKHGKVPVTSLNHCSPESDF